MNSYLWIIVAVLFLVTAWFVRRYYDLRKRLERYANEIRRHDKKIPTYIKGIENLSNAVASFKTAFDLRLKL